MRAFLAAAERAAEEKDIQTLKRLISDGYRDDEGNRKAELIRLVGYHLLHNESIHLLMRVRTIEFPSPERAAVIAYLAMAGREIPAVDLLAQLHADLYRLELDLTAAAPGEWTLARANWRQALAEDFVQ